MKNPSPPHATTASNVMFAAATIIILNTGFFLFAYAIDAPRPCINLDYAVALTVYSFGFQILGVVLGLAFLLADSLVLIGQILPFPRISDLFYLLKFSVLTSTLHQALIFFAFALIAVKLSAIPILGKHTKPISALIVLNFLLVATYMFSQLRENENLTTKYWRVETPMVASQTSSLFMMRSSIFLDFFRKNGEAFKPGSPGASIQWSTQGVNSIEDRLLLIVVESWGEARNKKIEEALLAPFYQVPATLFETGNTKFDGFTIDGELRELCRLVTVHFNLRDIEAGFENCLPNQLKAAGYKTIAMHGATGMMYDRRHWYPRAGFEEIIFFEDRVWPKRCYSFPGACDLDMLPELANFFSQSGKRFMYWLTLNTHAPYDMRDLRTDHFDCVTYGVDKTSESCRLLKLKADFFAELAQQLRSDALKGVDVIIVGDHAPKMLNFEDKIESFSTDSVPWVRIKTKS